MYVHIPGTALHNIQVLDLVGNAWEYTDEFVDDHTRAAVLRGGSNYKLPYVGFYPNPPANTNKPQNK